MARVNTGAENRTARRYIADFPGGEEVGVYLVTNSYTIKEATENFAKALGVKASVLSVSRD